MRTLSVNSNVLFFVSFYTVVTIFAEGVPTARLVYPRLLEERSSDGGMVVKVHDDLTLNLRKGSVAARELRVLTEEDGRPVTHFYNGEDIERNLYEDEQNIASLMVTKTGDGVRMEGLVSPSHRIKPTEISEKSEDGLIPHEIHEIEQKEMLDKTLTYRSKTSDIAPRERTFGARVPVSVEIEVFVVLDTKHHRHFNSTTLALRYLCIMINSANIRYRATSNPRVQLLLTGVEKAVREDFVVTGGDNGYLYDDGTISRFRLHALRQKSTYGKPDLVFLMTGRDVFTYYQGKLTDSGLGIGYVCGVCSEFYVALGEDNPGLFSGTHTFTHEVAHLLGAKHDGDGPDVNTPGHPGAASCSWNLGHIMSYVNKGPSHHRFSTCTLEQISYVLSRAGEKCWRVISEGTSVKNIYPGMAVTFQKFCEVLPYDKENSTFERATVNDQNCRVQCYFYRLYTYEGYYGPERYKARFKYEEDALDFMPCGYNRVCIQGICQTKPHMVTDSINGTLRTHRPSEVTTTTTRRARPTYRRTFSRWYRRRV